MNNTIFLRLAGLKIAKQSADIRGKKFLQKQEKIKKIFEKLFKSEATALIRRMTERSDLVGVQIIQKSEWWEEILAFFENDPIFLGNLSEILQEIYNLGIDDEFRERNAEIGGSFDINNIFSKNYATERAGELMQGVSETTKKEVREIFADSWTTTDSTKQISEKIQNKFGNFAEWRANLIAMQETSLAYEVGRADQFAKLSRDTGITGWKRSQSQGDDTVRPSHRQNELDGWIANDEPFSGTGTQHAPHGFRCRCVVVRRLLEPSIDDKLDIYADVKVNLPENVKIDLLNGLQKSMKKTPNLPRPIIEDEVDFYKKFGIQNSDYFAVTYGDKKLTKIVLGSVFYEQNYTRNTNLTYAHRFENIYEATIIHEMGHAIEQYVGRIGKRAELDEIHNFLYEKYANLPLENIQRQESIFDKKRELFAEFYTLYIMGEKVPEEFVQFISLL